MAFLCDDGQPRRDLVPGALHRLPATPATVHWGYFDPATPPVLRVKSGDLIAAEAVTHHAGDAPELMMDAGVTAIFEGIPEADRNPGVHIMTGPIFVEDARPGDMLEVRYLRMTPRCAYGSNLAANWGQLYGDFGERERVTIYALDEPSQLAHAVYAYDFPGQYLVPGTITHCPACDRQTALSGVRVPTRPHLGAAGVAPDVHGRVSSIPPGAHGGNIDNWRIGAGATMFYPVAVDGALFSIGDPHVSQGDGEVSGTAIEASLDVLFQIVLRRDFTFPTPLLETPKHWIVHGFDEDLNLAMRAASLDMLKLLTEHQGLSAADAYSLMSVAADFAVTQVVDGKQGVHGRIARSLFPHAEWCAILAETALQAWRFSTRGVQAPERGSAWRAAMARLRLPMGMVEPPAPFEGEVVCLTSPRGLEFAVVEGSPQEVAGRDADQPDALWLSVLLEGRASLSAGDAAWELQPGDIVHGRTGSAATLRFETRFRQLYVKAPRLALGHRLAQPLSPEVGRLAGDRGINAIFSALLRATAERLEELTSEDLRPVEIAVTEFLIAALIDEGGAVARGGAAGARAARLHRVCQLIEGRLGDPDLTLADIALEDGSSPRHLQALFAGAGLNFTAYLRNRRLERCRADLASPLFGQRSISDICFRWGFSASSHFSRAFRARYGVSPRAFRDSSSAA